MYRKGYLSNPGFVEILQYMYTRGKREGAGVWINENGVMLGSKPGGFYCRISVRIYVTIFGNLFLYLD